MSKKDTIVLTVSLSLLVFSLFTLFNQSQRQQQVDPTSVTQLNLNQEPS